MVLKNIRPLPVTGCDDYKGVLTSHFGLLALMHPSVGEPVGDSYLTTEVPFPVSNGQTLR